MAKTTTAEKWVLMTELNGEALLHHFKLSNHGNVVRIKKGTGAEEPFDAKSIGGYKYISFTTREGSRETIYLHRLVAEFFVDAGDENRTYVIHKDYNRNNNRFDNLEWVTQEVLYAHRSAKAGRISASKQSPQRNRHLQSEVVANQAQALEDVRVRRMVGEYFGISQ